MAISSYDIPRNHHWTTMTVEHDKKEKKFVVTTNMTDKVHMNDNTTERKHTMMELFPVHHFANIDFASQLLRSFVLQDALGQDSKLFSSKPHGSEHNSGQHSAVQGKQTDRSTQGCQDKTTVRGTGSIIKFLINSPFFCSLMHSPHYLFS
ncbi:hypothetical protein CAEBREN_15298 [Caenorhabditis brenneri]|uniref:Uncharacterized protein n=1 Tax=Caenorhabditis brenneri TaxID=135651 RepID=G0P0N0_CAEBE|nr:hypothetical protein CAEBREN_15298 [Caenorhabditis brenneri]